MNDHKTALIISTLASFLTPFMVSSLNVALPSVALEFSLDAIEMGWIATSYLLAAAVFLVPFGRLADIYGRKKIFLWGVCLYTLFSVAIVASGSGVMLIALRACQGFGAAMIFGTGVALLISASPPAVRGRVLGINVAAVYLGLSVGPFLGGLLTQQLGWRSIFILNGILGLAIVSLTLARLRGEWAEARGERFDLAGAGLLTLSLFLLMYGSSRLPSGVGVWLTLGGCVILAVFGTWEHRAPNPLLDVRLFSHNPVFLYSNAAALINYSATAAVTFLLSLYLQYVRGLSPQLSGIVLVAQPICMTVISPFAGRWSDRVEPRVLSSLGMGITALGLCLFTLIGGDTSLTIVVVNLLILGCGFGLFSSPNTNAVMSSVRREAYGVASATLGTMRLSGQMLSMGIVMAVLSLQVGRVQITPPLYGAYVASMRWAFVLFSVLCVLGIFLSLARGNVRSAGQPSPGPRGRKEGPP